MLWGQVVQCVRPCLRLHLREMSKRRKEEGPQTPTSRWGLEGEGPGRGQRSLQDCPQEDVPQELSLVRGVDPE